MQAEPMLTTLRVAVLGDSGAGKRTFIQKLGRKQNDRLKTAQSVKSSPEQVHFHLESTIGPCQISLVLFQIDIEETKKNEDQFKEVLSQLKACDNAFLMFSMTERQTYKSIPSYYNLWRQATQDKECVLISTKADCYPDLKVKPRMITYHRKKNIQLYCTSSKASYNLLRPFQYLLTRKEGGKSVYFINSVQFIDSIPEVEFEGKALFEKQITQFCQPCYNLPEVEDE